MGIFLILVASCWAVAQTADLAVVEATIYTVDDRAPVVTAMAVKDGRVLATGDAVQRHIGPSTRLFLGGVVVPGFIDSHVHMNNYGAMLESFDFRSVRTPEEIARQVGERAAKVAKGEWIVGRAWDQTNWGGAFPVKGQLDATTPDHPVVLRRVDGHASWANSRALREAGVTRTTQDPPGGKIVRDEAGEPTGVLIDTAMRLVQDLVPAPTDAQVERRLLLAAADCIRQGLTSVHDAGVDRQTLTIYERLVSEGRMPLRVYVMIGGDGELWRERLRRGPVTGAFLTVRALKLVADGAMGSGGAAFFQPYSDDKSNKGLLITSKERIAAAAKQAVDHGFQVCTHAIGDYANRIALDAYSSVLDENNSRRFRIEHAQIVSLPDFSTFKKYNVIASVQATHATSDMRWALKKLGPDRLMGAYAWQRFLQAGVRIAKGSDFPVESNKPLWGFYAAVTRQNHQGKPSEGFLPDQRLTREQALKSFTLDGAYAAFEEKDKGSLAPGKLADFVLLDRDIMKIPSAEILETKIVKVFVAGQER
jgi:predicted amidohydrolase YtcJ